MSPTHPAEYGWHYNEDYFKYHWASMMSTYLKRYYLKTSIVVNSLGLLYYALPIQLELYIGLVILLMILLKQTPLGHYLRMDFADDKDVYAFLMSKMKIELIKLNWLINKFTRTCFQYMLLSLALFYLIDQYLSPTLSFWIVLNLITLYFSLTKYSRNTIKYHCGLFKDYSKYVINIIEPNSPEENSEDREYKIFSS